MHDRLTRFLAETQALNTRLSHASFAVAFPFFLVSRFAVALVLVVRFLVATPIHIAYGPRRSFESLTPRDAHGTYQRSYTSHLREERVSAALATFIITLVAVRVVTVVIVTKLTLPPRAVSAVSSSVSLNPIWDRSAYRNDQTTSFPDCSFSTLANCESATATILKSGLTLVDVGCGEGLEDRFTYRSAMQFSLTSIPDNATITDVDFDVNVSTTTTSTIAIVRTSVDNIQSSTCTSTGGTGMYSRMGTGTTYVSATDWTTTGAKTYDLGATADSDVQARLTAGDAVTIAMSSATATTGQASSVDAASNKPLLTIAYTTPPETPTGASHSANTPSTITWSWTDNATADTSNVVHDAGHSVKCTAGAISGTGSTAPCQETTLAANTQYTRHINVIDNEGNTDSPSASAYTSIETPSGVTFSNVSATGFTATASGTLSNVSSGSAGVYCQESVTSTNSGWAQTTSWDKSSLTANTQYSVQCKARNGDGDETSLTSAATKYTLPASAAVTSVRSATTWYITPGFGFRKTTGWGVGGVQYLRTVFNHSPTHAFVGTEGTWSEVNGNCPGGTCTASGTTLTQTANADGQDWYLHMIPYNAEDVAGTGQDLGPFWFDGAAPSVSVPVTDATQTSVTVTWTTNTSATSQVEYGTTTGYGSLTAIDTTPVSNHSVSIAPLTPGVTYHLRVRSKDSAGNEGVSADVAKATLPPDPATVSDMQVASVGTTSATIAWTTSLAATSAVEYGPTTTYGGIMADTALVTTHALTLTDLTPRSIYHFRISGVDVNDQGFTSGDASFTTSTVATAPATPTLDSPVHGDYIFDRRPTFTGLATNSMTVVVTIDGKENGTTVAGVGSVGLGTFTFRPTSLLVYGGHSVSVAARDVHGLTSTDSAKRTFTVAAPTTNRSVATAVVTKKNLPTVVITGKAPLAGKVRIILDRSVMKTIRVKKAQVFRHSVAASAKLATGKHTIVLQFLDTKGKVKQTSRLVTFTKAGQQSVVQPVPIELEIDGGFTIATPDRRLWKKSLAFFSRTE